LHYAIASYSSAGYWSGSFCFPIGAAIACGNPPTSTVTVSAGANLSAGLSFGGASVSVGATVSVAQSFSVVGKPCQVCQLYLCFPGSSLRQYTWSYDVVPPGGGPVYTASFTTYTFSPGGPPVATTSCTPANTWCCNHGFPNCCPPGPTGCPGGGDCYVPHPSGGCEDAECCQTVCASDPFCCDVMWEQFCADLAADFCLAGDQPGAPDDLGPVVIVDLAEFVTGTTGSWPAGHPVYDAVTTFEGLSQWHLCQIQNAVALAAEQLGEDPGELIIFNADGTPNTFDLDADPNPFGISTADSFDGYVAGSALHGQGGWEGWNGIPAFTAFVSDTQAQSPPNSAEVSGDADLVHEHCTDGAGWWSYEAWQYIPADFASGGGGALAGSYFVLLNTYPTENPASWSVQMQFDSNDGMLKVFHGDGTNTINVPYDTDRWVKIQTIVDLEEDWTRVYYDDELITEYAWTGGVIGGGGGTLDVAAVDLYAQGSTAVYYDDLLLRPIDGCGDSLDSDYDEDGSTLLEEFLNGTDPCVAEPAECPADLDDDGMVGVTDFLELLAQWGTEPGGPPDFDGGGVGVTDFLYLLTVWGPCP
jgi:hypothetical protein